MTSDDEHRGPERGLRTIERKDEQAPTLLDLEVTAGALTGPCLVGRCLEDRHPTLRGRVLATIADGHGGELSTWLATLQDLPVRAGDHLLVIQPRNWPEPVVAGVLDGFGARPERRRQTAAELSLRADEALSITDAAGTRLVEVFPTPEGPVVRLLDDRVNVELAGALRLSAREIHLAARQGEVTIDATADVVVTGETIQLN